MNYDGKYYQHELATQNKTSKVCKDKRENNVKVRTAKYQKSRVPLVPSAALECIHEYMHDTLSHSDQDIVESTALDTAAEAQLGEAQRFTKAAKQEECIADAPLDTAAEAQLGEAQRFTKAAKQEECIADAPYQNKQSMHHVIKIDQGINYHPNVEHKHVYRHGNQFS